MEQDFTYIDNYISWCRGPELHILDTSCSSYAFAFNQYINNQWCNVHSSHDFKSNYFHKSNYKYRIKWQIKVWKWTDRLVQVLQSTYDEKNKNICLSFKHDDYEAHKSWFIKSVKLSLDNHFSLYIISKFSTRLKKEFRNYPVFLIDNVDDLSKFEEDNQIYASYIIDRHELLTKSGWDWHSNKIFLNHTNPSTSWDHPDDWLGKNYDQIYNNIMGI